MKERSEFYICDCCATRFEDEAGKVGATFCSQKCKKKHDRSLAVACAPEPDGFYQKITPEDWLLVHDLEGFRALVISSTHPHLPFVVDIHDSYEFKQVSYEPRGCPDKSTPSCLYSWPATWRWRTMTDVLKCLTVDLDFYAREVRKGNIREDGGKSRGGLLHPSDTDPANATEEEARRVLSDPGELIDMSGSPLQPEDFARVVEAAKEPWREETGMMTRQPLVDEPRNIYSAPILKKRERVLK